MLPRSNTADLKIYITTSNTDLLILLIIKYSFYQLEKTSMLYVSKFLNESLLVPIHSLKFFHSRHQLVFSQLH